jgi:hypothetical protein
MTISIHVADWIATLQPIFQWPKAVGALKVTLLQSTHTDCMKINVKLAAVWFPDKMKSLICNLAKTPQTNSRGSCGMFTAIDITRPAMPH